MASPDLTPDEWMTLIVGRAGDLRKAGVTKLTIDGVGFELSAHEPQLVERVQLGEVDDGAFLNPLDDPKTYGRASGTPGFERPRKGGDQ